MANDEEIQYLQFLGETHPAVELSKVHSNFPRKVFDYAKGNKHINGLGLSALVLEVVNQCKRFSGRATWMHRNPLLRWIKKSANTGEPPEILENRFIRHNADEFSKDVLGFLNQPSFKLQINDNFLEIPTLTFAQKLDVLHLVICALYQLSRNEPLFKEINKTVQAVKEKLIVFEVQKGVLEKDTEKRILEAQNKESLQELEWASENPPNLSNNTHTEMKHGGRPPGHTKIPKENMRETYINAFNQCFDEQDEMPTLASLAALLKVNVSTVKTNLKNCGLDSMNNLKIEAEKKRKVS